MQNTGSKTRLLVANGLIAALYVALCFIAPASGAIQFRVSESLNHLVVFNKKLIWGVVLGCVIFNIFFGYGIMDVIFGGGQTLLALLVMSFLHDRVKNVKTRLVINVLLFSASMFLIAIMLNITAELPFWPTFATTALSEAIIMTISAPIMYWVDKKVNFQKRF
ncbi:QueT transporter family protein [Enterococcus timonensis]|uniref:QueT transporter family protein n=1 Tax=Enterococcus timonensis TaxID=1852364 RepID=UPI0008DABDB2|nr:QueT transporter family protein [Enterococcus timonensis]